MPSIDAAYIWAVNACNAADIGYSTIYRNQQTVNGITYYDCSSFIFYALKAGGFDVEGTAYTTATGSAYTDNAITTTYEGSWLTALGFTRYDFDTTQPLPGDILWRSGHTEMVYSSSGVGLARTMGAHTNGVALANQVSINNSESSNWTYGFRYGSGGSGSTTYQWIAGTAGEYFGDPELPLCGDSAQADKAKNNAGCLLQYFYAKGWTLQAIAALCGNIQQESTFNPNCLEFPSDPSIGGYGIVQWTPHSALYEVLDWLYGEHNDWYLGEKQCEAIYAEYRLYIGEIPSPPDPYFDKQWYPSLNQHTEFQSDMRWDEWASSTEDPGFLANVFQVNYLRPAAFHAERAQYARDWYDYLLTLDPNGGGGGITKRRTGKFWLFMRNRWQI